MLLIHLPGLHVSMPTMSARGPALRSWSAGGCLPLRRRAPREASSVTFMAMSTRRAEMGLRSGVLPGRRWGRYRFPVDAPTFASGRRGRCSSAPSNHCGGFSWRKRRKGRCWGYDVPRDASELGLASLGEAYYRVTVWCCPVDLISHSDRRGHLTGNSNPVVALLVTLCTLSRRANPNHAS